eukprot:9158347-Pyramimonas_sp.AAC.2
MPSPECTSTVDPMRNDKPTPSLAQNPGRARSVPADMLSSRGISHFTLLISPTAPPLPDALNPSPPLPPLLNIACPGGVP